jgi:hypothetical protein
VQRGDSISVTFTSGDQLGARASASGQVYVYKNASLLGVRDVTGWPYYGSSGYIGLWFIMASDAVLDDFGGGDVTVEDEAGGGPVWGAGFGGASQGGAGLAAQAGE